jgi:hypothetical protein
MVPAWLDQRNKGIRAFFAFDDECHSAHLHTPYIVSKHKYTLVSTVEGRGCKIGDSGAVLAGLESSGGFAIVFLRHHIIF